MFHHPSKHNVPAIPDPQRLRKQQQKDNISHYSGKGHFLSLEGLIDVFDKKVTLRVGDESMVFDLSESMKHPKESDGTLYYNEKLLGVLKEHKRAIAWKISNIKGINLSYCTYKILMEEDYKPVVQHQRRVNPNIKEVVKKGVVKLLNAGLIYPISDSPWVSPVKVVPKKGGMTVVMNEKNDPCLQEPFFPRMEGLH
ncbi:hypothetical protein Tco_0690251 [Tanacetum coccineum]